MQITFRELCLIIANAKSVSPDFWITDPLYIELGTYAERRAVETQPLAVNDCPDVAIDLNSEEEAMGIEFLPA